MSLNIIFDSYYGKGDLATIEDFERILGVELPKDYKDIVAEYNGAFIINKNVFRFFSHLVGEEVVRGVGMFLPFGQIEDVTETMEIKWQYPPEGFPKGLVMFSAMGNGDALCFDFREQSRGSPSVVVWHHEGMPGGENEISFVAETFADFLKILFEEDNE